MKKIAILLFYICAGISLNITISIDNMAYGQNFSGLSQPESSPDHALLEDTKGDASGTIPKIVNDSMAVDDSTYTLGVNDVIEITVARHPEVSKQYIINSEGKIQYEFVGDIEISGLTKKKANDLIAQRLSTYIVSPEVTIKIIGYNSKVVYIIGEVGSPGKIYMRGDTITVREALLQAGLPLLSASTRKCRLITPSEEGKAKKKYVDVFALLYEGNLRENYVMKPGDTLYIPATIMAKAMRVIQPVAQPVTAAASAARPVVTGGL